MRSIWKGEVSFGLVNVPVKVYSATEDHDLRARQVDKKDGVRIRYKKVRDDNGEEVEFSDIAKAYDSDEGEMVILTKDDLASLPAEQNHELEWRSSSRLTRWIRWPLTAPTSWSRRRGRIGHTC